MKRITILLSALLAGAPSARAYDTIRFLEPIRGEEMARPVAAAASADRLYVVDEKKNMLFLYDAQGKLIKNVGRSGSQNGSFSGPRGVAVGPNGSVYVADTYNHRVQIFDKDGNFKYVFGEKGAEPGKLKEPESVAVGVDGRIYVADTGNNRVQVFTQEGILLFQFGLYGKEPGKFHSPSRVSVDPSDNVYVLDRGNERMQKFDSQAKFVKEYSLLGNDAAVDAYGFLYVLDGKNGKVIEQSPDGFILGKFGSYGSGVGQLKKAEGIAVTPDGMLIVLDTGNNRIHRVELANKLKSKPLPLNIETKMSVTGPSRAWPVAATTLAPHGENLYAFLPKESQHVLLGPDGKELARFGKAKGKEGDVTRSAGGIAASKKMGVYIADTINHRLQRFGLDGKWQNNIGEAQGFFDSKKKEGRMRSPNGVAINEEGTIYVADTGNQRIDAFSPEGVFLFGIGPKVGNYMLMEPVALAWDNAGFLYFVDKGLKKVFKVEPSGAFLAAWGEDGVGPGQFKSPVSIAFDGQNYLYTLDSELRRVSVHTKDGKWLTDFFAGGKQERELMDPVSVAVQGQHLLIADQGKSRIVTYELHPQLAAPTAISTGTKEGIVALSWRPVEDPWTMGYQLYRASNVAGPYLAVGEPAKEPKAQDSEVVSYEKYWYRVATVAKTKDVGPWSQPLETFVAGAFNRAPVEISSVTLGNIFAANYKWYLKNPVGKVTVTNNVNVPFLNVKVTFKLKDFMDFGFDTEIKKLDPKQTVEIPLIATLNNRVLEVTEDTPIQAEFSLTYFESGDSKTVSLTKPLRLYSRNAITWNDPRKIANFITWKDEPIKSFKPIVGMEFKNRKAAALNRPVAKALRLWNALAEYGVKFAPNPANPFEQAKDDPNFPADYTQYPRETLKRKTGQCSDLTSLYSALLIDNEVRVGILDYPGHMTVMFDTEAEDAIEAGVPEDLLVEYDGTMWMPIEVTYVGKPFYEAVSKAAYAYKAEAEKGRVKVIDVDKAFREYEPVSMPKADFSVELPSNAALERRYDEQVNILAKDRYQLLKKYYSGLAGKGGKDTDAQLQLGIAEYQFGNREAAVTEFNKVLAVDPKNAAALNNLGSVAFLEGDFAEAEKRFRQASEIDPEDASVWLNLLKTQIKLKKADDARAAGEKAVALAPGYKPFVDNLVKGL